MFGLCFLWSRAYYRGRCMVILIFLITSFQEWIFSGCLDRMLLPLSQFRRWVWTVRGKQCWQSSYWLNVLPFWLHKKPLIMLSKFSQYFISILVLWLFLFPETLTCECFLQWVFCCFLDFCCIVSFDHISFEVQILKKSIIWLIILFFYFLFGLV